MLASTMGKGVTLGLCSTSQAKVRRRMSPSCFPHAFLLLFTLCNQGRCVRRAHNSPDVRCKVHLKKKDLDMPQCGERDWSGTANNNNPLCSSRDESLEG
jgi:hypothetical protein